MNLVSSHSCAIRLCVLVRVCVTGRSILCGEEAGEAAGGWGGVRTGVYGQAGEPSPHRILQGVYRQV